MKIITNLIFATLIFLLSCKKDSSNSINKTDFLIVNAGDADILRYSINHNFNSNLKQIDCWEKFGEDSIDFDNDKTFDFRLLVSSIGSTMTDSCWEAVKNDTAICSGCNIDYFPSHYPYNRLYSNYEILGKELVDEFRRLFIPDTLNIGDTLNNKIGWYHGRNICLWDGNGPKQDNKWMNVSKDKFIGFRKNVNGKYKYGWIRLITQPEIIIKDISIQK